MHHIEKAAPAPAQSLKKRILEGALSLAIIVGAGSAQAQLAAGPMLGHVEMMTARFWVQTVQPQKVQIKYWPTGKPAESKTTAAINTLPEGDHIAKPVATELLPGQAYEYRVLINGVEQKLPYATTFKTQALWQHRTDAPAFSMAIGSCYYHPEPAYDRPGGKYGDSLMIFRTVAAQKPDVMLWLGDNVYTREVDFGSKEGMYRRYRMARAEKELQPLLASTAHYAIWDDHDYGPNDADRGWAGKKWAEAAFNDYWCNPVTNATGQGGITGTMLWHDVQVFMLDDRFFRSPNADKSTGRKREYLGEAQLNWLLDNLIYSKARFKLVAIGGQVLNPVAAHENYATYAEEREQLLAAITKAKVQGVVFLSGDRHHTEVIKQERAGTYPLYDITASPLTSGVAKPGADETDAATGRLPQTLVNQRNFVVLNFSGPNNDRSMRMTCYNVSGKVLWEHTLKAGELK